MSIERGMHPVLFDSDVRRGQSFIKIHKITHEFPLKLIPKRAPPLSTQLLLDRMVHAGWCPYRIWSSCSLLSHTTIYYLSSFGHVLDTGLIHKHCSSDKCSADAQIFTPVKPLHRIAESCRCLNISCNMESVMKIIKSDGIPLIQTKRSSSGELELNVVKCAPYTRYTAISHVVRTKAFM
jgi:hypothetical protein